MTTCTIAATKTSAARAQAARAVTPSRSVGHEDDDRVERAEVDVRVDLHLLEEVGVGLARRS